MWRTQVRMGMVPYYMFVERDTGPQDYFAVPLARGYGIFRDGLPAAFPVSAGPSAVRRCRLRRARCASTASTEVAGSKVFVLHMIQARDPELVGTPFFARFDPAACWLTDLRPAFASRFPFEPARYEAVPANCPGSAREPDEPGELMVPAI